MQFIQLLVNPGEFFSALEKQQPSLKWPIILITIMGCFSAVVGYQMGELTGRLLSGMMPGLGTITAVITAVSAFFGTYIMWIIATVIFFAIQRFFKGQGSFTRVAEVTGYGMAPLIISSLVGIALAMYFLPMADITPVIGTDPEKINAAVEGLLLDPALHQFSIVYSIISIILMLWSVNILAFGFEACCKLDSRKAMMTAGIPVLLYIVYTLITLFVLPTGGLS